MTRRRRSYKFNKKSDVFGTLYVAVNFSAVLAFIYRAVQVYGDGRAAFGTFNAEFCFCLFYVKINDKFIVFEYVSGKIPLGKRVSQSFPCFPLSEVKQGTEFSYRIEIVLFDRDNQLFHAYKR